MCFSAVCPCVYARVRECVWCVCVGVRDICLHFPPVVSLVPVKAKSSLVQLTPSTGHQAADERDRKTCASH